MEIKRTQNGGAALLSLSGRLDTVTAPNLHEELDQAYLVASRVELDFTDVAYVSSAGLRVLLLGEKTAKANGKVMVIKNISDDVREIFEITGFLAILTIE